MRLVHVDVIYMYSARMNSFLPKFINEPDIFKSHRERQILQKLSEETVGYLSDCRMEFMKQVFPRLSRPAVRTAQV